MANYKLVYDDVIKNTSERLILDVVSKEFDSMDKLMTAFNKANYNKDNVNKDIDFTVDWENQIVKVTIVRTPKLGGVEVKYI